MRIIKLKAILVVSILTLTACSSDDDENKKEDDVDLRTEFVYCPDINHPHIIDMGDGGKWACCNIGAINPTDYGDYIAWGETGSKSSYTRTTYKHYANDSTFKFIGVDISGTKYDAASSKWGGSWKMPTQSKVEALIANCSHEWTTFSGVTGMVFTSKDGNSIFMPAGGRIWTETLEDKNIKGGYWTSTLDPDDPKQTKAIILNLKESKPGTTTSGRVAGRSIRPVQ